MPKYHDTLNTENDMSDPIYLDPAFGGRPLGDGAFGGLWGTDTNRKILRIRPYWPLGLCGLWGTDTNRKILRIRPYGPLGLCGLWGTDTNRKILRIRPY